MSPAYWTESESNAATMPAPSVIDCVFRIEGRQIPADHAWALSRELQKILPWLAAEPQAGIHLIHGAQSSHGWQRPEDDGIMELSGRTRLVIRIPTSRIDDATKLTGSRLDLAGYPLLVHGFRSRPLTHLSTVLAHYVRLSSANETEDAFLDASAEALAALSIRPKKMICGRLRYLTMPDSRVPTRSLLLAELSRHDSITIQTQGIGVDRLFGCGIFVPSKSISAVHQSDDEA